ncbi:MAG: serine/threonine-protein phosphatase [Gammaproteobacteria bacterium]|nr:serine/threonine-protein phosphatase [Gammaproteobacteria bacterium]
MSWFSSILNLPKHLLTGSSTQLLSSALTDTGCKRNHNEDSLLEDKKNHLYVVADGIGGHTRGEVASSESIKIVKEILFSKEVIELQEHDNLSQVDFEDLDDMDGDKFSEINHMLHAIESVNKSINSRNQKELSEKKKGMGTTFVGCWFLPAYQKVILFNIGDSRIYLFRNQELIQKTVDHSLLQYWLDHGQKGPKPNANIIVRAIGPREEVLPDLELFNYQKGDSWLICSDGLHGMLSDDQIQNFLQDKTESDKLTHYDSYAKELVDMANDAGGHDNISAILIHVV